MRFGTWGFWRAKVKVITGSARAIAGPALAAAVWLALAGAEAVSAQLAIPSTADVPTLDVEIERPFLPRDDGLAFYSSIIRVAVLFPVGSRATVALQAPLSIVGGDGDRDASMTLGNLRADLLLGTESGLRGYLGFTGLTATDIQDGLASQFFGVLPALDRTEDWIHDVLSLHGGVIPTLLRRGSTAVGGRVGLASIWHDDEDGADVHSRFGAWLRATGSSVRFDAEVGGSWLLGEEGGVGESSVVYLDAALSWHDRGGSPGFFVRVPLDENARDAMDLLVGVRISFGG